MKRLSTLLIVCLIPGAWCLAQKRIDLANALIWKETPEIYRVYHQKSYYLTDSKGRMLVDLSDYKSVGPIHNHTLTVQDRRGHYGLISISGDIILDTEWERIGSAMNGFVLAEKKNGGKVKEDRGKGNKWYDDTDYYLCRTNGQIINFKLDEATLIGNVLIGHDENMNSFRVDISAIHDFYAHPLMKAIEKINDQSVKAIYKQETSEIAYQSLDDGQIVYSLLVSVNED